MIATQITIFSDSLGAKYKLQAPMCRHHYSSPLCRIPSPAEIAFTKFACAISVRMVFFGIVEADREWGGKQI